MVSRIVLVIDGTESGKIAVETLEFLGKAGLKGDIYMLYSSEVEMPPISSIEKEMKIFTKLRLKASKVTEESKRKLENVGFNIVQIKIFFGSLSEEVLRLEKIIKPDLIIFGMEKRGLIKRILHGDPYREIIFNTKTPTIVCKPGFRRVEYCDYDESRCLECRFKAVGETD